MDAAMLFDPLGTIAIQFVVVLVTVAELAMVVCSLRDYCHERQQASQVHRL